MVKGRLSYIAIFAPVRQPSRIRLPHLAERALRRNSQRAHFVGWAVPTGDRGLRFAQPTLLIFGQSSPNEMTLQYGRAEGSGINLPAAVGADIVPLSVRFYAALCVSLCLAEVPMKRLPWGLFATGTVLLLAAAGVALYAYARAWRFVADSPTVRPSDVADLLSQAHRIAGICAIFGVVGVAAMIAGYALWAHER